MTTIAEPTAAPLRSDASFKKCPWCHSRFDPPDESTTCPVDGSLLIELYKEDIVGSVVDRRFVIDKMISNGGWSNVYYGHDLEQDCPVAIKFLRREFADDDQKILRFQREAYVISKLKSDYINQVYKYGVVPGGRPYIAMEYVIGGSLSDLMKRQVKLKLNDILNILMQVCQGLTVAHNAGIIHRDIKPSNIMITGGGTMSVTAKIIDFGLSYNIYNTVELTKSNETLGSPAYMSPEQCLGKRLDGRSDIYSLGCVMYEILTGKPAFVTSGTLDAMSQHVYALPAPFDDTGKGRFVSPALRALVMKCLEKDPAKRYQSAEDLRADLDHALFLAIHGGKDPLPKKPDSVVKKILTSPARGMANGVSFCIELYKALGVRAS